MSIQVPVNGTPLTGTINIDTEARVGLAYRNQLLTLAVDYYLIENEALLANPAFENLKSQYLAVGAESNAFDFAQLRMGARKTWRVIFQITRKRLYLP